MAQQAVDAMVRQLGDDRACRTAERPLPGSESGEYYTIGTRLRARETDATHDPLVCECEMVPRERLERALRETGTVNLDDIRRVLRLGMGPCQGGFCTFRAAGILHELDQLDAAEASHALLAFIEERWRGTWPILYGDQLRQARLDDWIYQGVLDVGHLPEAEAEAEAEVASA